MMSETAEQLNEFIYDMTHLKTRIQIINNKIPGNKWI
jgi:hypothetical protein